MTTIDKEFVNKNEKDEKDEKDKDEKDKDEKDNDKKDKDDMSNEFTTWDELDINKDILRGIYAYGFENPSPIQKKSIKPIINGKDIIAQAQSGTGKTGAFAISALNKIDLNDNSTQVMIISPTKELTIQTATVVSTIGCMMNGLIIKTLYGGSSIYEGFGSSDKKPHIICGCPGRIFDMIRREKIKTDKIKLVILDEADELLSSGFKEQVYNIFQYFSNDIQVALFSATLPENIFTITDKIMRDPIKVSIKTEMLTLEGISQYYVAVEDDRQKYATLKHIFSFISMSQSIIYCNSVKRVADLYDAMKEDDFPVCCIHSNMEKTDRENAFNDFKNGKCRVLISSNVTSRGIDIQQVSTVINFDIPKCVHNYLHRIGRSGRWGRKGVGINFITRRDTANLKEIEQHYSTQIMEMPSDLGFINKF
jgi:superfamily II DNA/RNA helicase